MDQGTARLEAAIALDEASDAALVAYAGGGVPDALTALYDRYQAQAYALALRVTGNPADAQDALQDAFVAAWRSAGAYVPARGSVAAWLLTIVRNRAVDRLRQRRPTEELPDADAPSAQALVEPGPWSEVATRLDREAIIAAMAAIPPRQREAIELAYFGGLTQHEIAARTNSPLGTVKGRVRLGLLALREQLSQYGMEANRDVRSMGSWQPAGQARAHDPDTRGSDREPDSGGSVTM